MRTSILCCLVFVTACYQSPCDPPTAPSGTESGCLSGFVATHGECAIPVSCRDFPDQCPQDGGDCLVTATNCYPDGQSPPSPPACQCTTDTDAWLQGYQYCDDGTCSNTPPGPACQCFTDAQAQAQGYAACDEHVWTCTNTPQPPQSCGVAVTCTTAPPACPAGQVPAQRDGCYTGTCRAIDGCDVPPACTALAHEADCTARTDCEPLYTGLDCTDPEGNSCTSGDSNCTCKQFQFSACAAL